MALAATAGFRMAKFGWWNAKIHLFLEAVHFGDLHLHFVAEPDHPARAASDEMAARFVEHIKIIFERGEMHEAAHRQTGNDHKKSEIAHVNDGRRIRDGFAGLQLR